jgi:hypothetical protein
MDGCGEQSTKQKKEATAQADHVERCKMWRKYKIIADVRRNAEARRQRKRRKKSEISHIVETSTLGSDVELGFMLRS